MSTVLASIIPSSEENFISKSKNYRIFSLIDPIYYASQITSYSESNDVGSVGEENVYRSFRYSTNKIDWSLWYQFSPNDINEISALQLDSTKPFFIDIKIMCDDGTTDDLAENFVINSIKIGITTTKIQPEKSYEFRIRTSDEQGPSIDVNALSTFRPYVVNSANQLYIGMSYQTNIMFGHDVLYFRTVPDLSSGDFIFKEWTIQNMGDRKCIKVLVPNNEFPDNKPKFMEMGIEFEAPFEVHIDNSYFQLMFGRNAKPRVRDFMYIPIMDRVYEIKSCYLHKGFMLEPIYWKLSLVKYQPSIDMVIDDKHKEILSDLITSADDLFKNIVKNDIADTSLSHQLNTTTSRIDNLRHSISKQAKITKFEKTFMYMSLIDRYYDMSNIENTNRIYEIDNDLINLTGSPTQIIAVRNSQLYSDWKNNLISSGDINVFSSISPRPIRITGPYDNVDINAEKYVEVKSYSTAALTKQRNMLVNNTVTPHTISFDCKSTGLYYNVNPILNDNITISFSFLLKSDAEECKFISGINSEDSTGIEITWIKDEEHINISVNTEKNVNFDLSSAPLSPNKWYSGVIAISKQFSQIGLYIYEYEQDSNNKSNWNSIYLKYSDKKENIPIINFDSGSRWSLPAGKHYISNIRVIDELIPEEKYEYLVTTQIVTNLGIKAKLVDNCKERLDLPYISLNQ